MLVCVRTPRLGVFRYQADCADILHLLALQVDNGDRLSAEFGCEQSHEIR